jgi:hypothetical protein
VVLAPLRPFLVADPLEDSFVDQPAKTLGLAFVACSLVG